VRGSKVSIVFTCVCVVVKKSEQKPCARGGKKINKSLGSDAVGRRRSISVDLNTNKIEGGYSLELYACVWVGG